MRRKIIALLLVVATASFLVQLKVNKPVAGFDKQPAGWASSLATKDLAGNLAAFHTAAAPVQLSANDYARITAYASIAYMETRYRHSGTPEDGSAAFFLMVRSLMPDPTFHATLPKTTETAASRKGVKELLEKSSADGYDFLDWPGEPVRFSSPLDLGPDKSQYTWAPVMGNGPELEREWGRIKGFHELDCPVPPPPVRSVVELAAAAKKVTALTRQMEANEFGDGLTTLGFAYSGGYWMRSEPVRIWLQIVANAATDKNLPERDRDRMLATAAMIFHDTMIETWRAKYTYLLAHPLAMDRDTFPYVNAHAPSYPSEHTAVAMAGAAVLDHYASGAQPRIELPGSVISAPTTRVLRDSSAAVREFGAVAQMMGLAYDFDVVAGRELGKCVAAKVLEVQVK